jgi:xanthine/uracil/vitamin C permease (AzgA family)
MTELAATFRRSTLDGYFKFADNGTTLARDTMAAQGDWRRINPLLYLISAGFVLYFLVPLLQDTLSWV